MRSLMASRPATDEHWPMPLPIPCELALVDELELEFLPARLAPWIDDIASRLQCPPDYPAIAAITALGALLGRRIGIKPAAAHCHHPAGQRRRVSAGHGD